MWARLLSIRYRPVRPSDKAAHLFAPVPALLLQAGHKSLLVERIVLFGHHRGARSRFQRARFVDTAGYTTILYLLISFS